LFRCRLSHTDLLGGVSGRGGGQRGQRDGMIVASYRVLCFECHRHPILRPRSCRFRIRCRRVFLRRMYSAVRREGSMDAYREVFALRHRHSPSRHRHHNPCGRRPQSWQHKSNAKRNRQREVVTYVITKICELTIETVLGHSGIREETTEEVQGNVINSGDSGVSHTKTQS
jgi:hypothetical protein